ncbi:MAG: hypothetical protein WCP39_07125 [Chlamydiota bacterium]
MKERVLLEPVLLEKKMPNFLHIGRKRGWQAIGKVTKLGFFFPLKGK